MTTRFVPLYGVHYRGGGFRDPRLPALYTRLKEAGIDVRFPAPDCRFVYIAGWWSDVQPELERIGLLESLRLAVVGCARCRSLTGAAN